VAPAEGTVVATSGNEDVISASTLLECSDTLVRAENVVDSPVDRLAPHPVNTTDTRAMQPIRVIVIHLRG
jgi:hypothetical protein